MTARTRVLALVAAAAAVVVAAVVGGTWLQARGESTTVPGAVTKPRVGIPPLFFDFGVRDDAQARALARGARLLHAGRRAQAAAVFARYRSVQAQIGSAFARWPNGSLAAVERLASAYPQSAVAELHYGLALLWAGRNAAAETVLQQVEARHPDSASAVDAESILYGRDIPGLPYLIVDVTPPAAPTLARQVALAARAAAKPDAQARLLYGVMLWRLDRRVSARRELDAAAALAPGDPVVLTADAVSHFTKKDPTAAFARLGPLTGRFPQAAVVRLHLGVLLLWTRQIRKGIEQLRLAAAEHPRSIYAREARSLLEKLVRNGTR